MKLDTFLATYMVMSFFNFKNDVTHRRKVLRCESFRLVKHIPFSDTELCENHGLGYELQIDLPVLEVMETSSRKCVLNRGTGFLSNLVSSN